MMCADGMSGSNQNHDHDRRWNDLLLDWLDGEISPQAARKFEAHRAQCPLCQQQLRDFARLDASMHAALPPLSPGNSFDSELLARIEAIDESQRLAARLRAERELRENLRSLSRGWWRHLGLILPGIAAGLASALALAGWFDDSGMTQTLLSQSPIALGSQAAYLAHITLLALLGAGLGLTVGRWLGRQ